MDANNEITGERLTPGILNENSIEHLHRYALARSLAENKTVLDIACGEGYGSNLLSEKAFEVTGADLDKQTISRAKSLYKINNLHFIESDIRKINCKDNIFDLVVCFETIEHIEDHENAMNEIKRVLNLNGILIISTPNKHVYSDENKYNNPFHKKELNRKEFENLLIKHFTYYKIYDQVADFKSYISNDDNNKEEYYTGNFQKIDKINKPAPSYFIGIASDISLPELNNSYFNGKEIINQALQRQEKIIMSTITYKIGHLLLWPLKLIRKILGK